ncbi:MAG: hypothetical protein ABIA78_01955, partial [archaeon]
MVYKKYIKKGGKTYCPYNYKSVRRNGKVTSEYVGDGNEGNNLLRYFSFGVLFFFVALLLIFAINSSLTGNVSADIKTKYQEGELLKGNLKFSLKKGELLPADSKVIVSFEGDSQEYFLSEIIDIATTSGSFYIEDIGILGEGVGYGILGVKKVYPEVDFKLKIVNEDSEQEESGEESEVTEEVKGEESVEEIVNETEIGEVGEEGEESVERVNETGVEEVNEEDSGEQEKVDIELGGKKGKDKEKNKNEDKEKEKNVEEQEGKVGEEPKLEESEESEEIVIIEDASEEQGETESSFITGEVIVDDVIFGTVSKTEEFTHNVPEGDDAVLIESSVTFDGDVLSDDVLTIKNKKKSVVVSTKYFIEEEGFGEEYVGKDGLILKIQLSEFNFTVNEDSELSVFLIYEGSEIVSVSKSISVINGTVDEIVSEVEEIIISEENATDSTPLGVPQNIELRGNKTEVVVITNETIVNDTIVNSNVSVNVNTTQYGAVLNKPVKWKKLVKVDKEGEIKVIIPKQAENITIYQLEGNNSGEKLEGEEEVNEIVVEEEKENEGTIVEEVELNGNETVIEEEQESEKFGNKKVVEHKSAINAEIISGEVSAEIDTGEESFFDFFSKLFSFMTGRVVDVAENEEVKEVIIINEWNTQEGHENFTQSEAEFEIGYETPGPVAFESPLGDDSGEPENIKGKIITISSEVHYENILAYTGLPYPV